MEIFKTKTGILNILVALLTVLVVAFMFIPSVTYEPGTEDEGTVSIFGYVFFPTEKPYKYVTNYFEDAVDPDGEFEANDVFAEPMLLLVFCIVSCIICFAGYKNVISSLFPIVWGVIGIKGCLNNLLFTQSSMQWVYFGLIAAVLVLTVLSGILNLFFKKKEVEA